MTSLQSDFKNKLNNLSVFEKIMALNVVVFLLGLLIHIFGNIQVMISIPAPSS